MTMTDQLLLDTDILIDYLRDRDAAVAYLRGCSSRAFSRSALIVSRWWT